MAGLEARGFICGSVTIPPVRAQIYPFVPSSQPGNQSIYWALLTDFLHFQVCGCLAQARTLRLGSRAINPGSLYQKPFVESRLLLRDGA